MTNLEAQKTGQSTPGAVQQVSRKRAAPLLITAGVMVTLAVPVAAGGPSAPVGTAVQTGRFWGETASPVRSLVPAGVRPIFRWEGDVQGYAVLEVTDEGVAARDCGRGGVRADRVQWNGKGVVWRNNCLVLSVCAGPGRVRVVQPVNLASGARPLVEIDNRAARVASRYVVEGHAVPMSTVDNLHVPPAEIAERWKMALRAEASGSAAEAADHWSWVATHALDDAARLWAIEKFCRVRPYPGPAPSSVEQKTLAAYAENEPIEALMGTNVILAWPKDYAANCPIKWRFLAETDAALDWLKVWTGKDQVAVRGKRLISRFRTDKGGVALYVDFRLHIPRAEMKSPPDHGPHSHEASHGFVGFPAICPTGRYGEGLTEVSRVSYWWFLGLDDSWRPFRAKCLRAIQEHRQKGGKLDDVPSYAAAAGVYFTVEEGVRSRPGDLPDWSLFARLFQTARDVEVAKDMPVAERFGVFASYCEKAWGPKAPALIQGLAPPGSLARTTPPAAPAVPSVTPSVRPPIVPTLSSRQITIKMTVDGVDKVRIRGGLLWIEHVSAGKPASISINGVPWTPTWRGKESEPFSRLETALASFVNSRVSLKRLAGRGPVTLVEQPTFANQQTISILLEDRGAGSDVYEVTVSW